LVIREGVHTGQILINLVVASKYFDIITGHKKLWETMLAQLKQNTFLQKEVYSFMITENNGLADVVKSQDANQSTLRGPGYYEEELHYISDITKISTRRRVSPFSFFQTNTLGAELLFQTAMDKL
jgi:23S rRNA (uracil1939-C5)-methyltransferase